MSLTDTISEKYILDTIIKNFFNEKGIVSHQIDSFNYYINNGIQDVINSERGVDLKFDENKRYVLEFGSVYVTNPTSIQENRKLKKIFPQEARNRDLNYDGAITCDLKETIYEDDKIIKSQEYNRVIIGRTPLMVMSNKCNLVNITKKERIERNECEYDNGGYFIIKGNERTITAQLRANYNQPIVIKQKDKDKYKYICEIRSMSEETGHSVQLKVMVTNDDKSVLFSLPYIKNLIPVGIVFKALGFLKNEDIYNFIGMNDKRFEKYIKFIVRDSFFIETQEQALEYIGKYSIHIIPKGDRVKYAKQVCETELFPHIGICSTNKEICIMLGYIINKLLSTNLGIRTPDDRDNYANKRIETTGILCTELFRTLFKRFLNTIKLQLEKKKCQLNAISLIRKNNNITNGLKYCFSTGNWGVQKNAYIRKGVCQLMSRMTYGSTLSHMRRIIIPIGKEGKNAKIRQLHSSQFGYICPIETPEGKSSGIVLNFSLMATVTKKVNTVIVKNVLEKNKYIIDVNDIETKDIKEYTYIFINGALLGMTKDPYDLTLNIKKLRKTNILDKDVSVSYDMIDNCIKIYCDAGRITRPLFSVDEITNKLNINTSVDSKWSFLVKNNYIEYIDASEIENYIIAMTPNELKNNKKDYCEIHPSMIHGVMGSTIPFPDHSPSPRNCYQCSMGKQALGIYSLGYKNRTDTISYVLDYPQKPLVSTKHSEYMGFNEMPSGINAVVAIMSYTGYNQEDSIILNKSAVQRGLFSVSSYRTIVGIEKKSSMYSFERIQMPPQSSVGIKKESPGYFKRKNGNYSLLDKNGIIRKGIKLKPGDIIIGKVLTKVSKNGVKTLTDCSISIKSGEEGIIDTIFVSNNTNGYKMVKIKIRKHRIPEIGDKFASRAAQKGTCGATYNQEDMPFNSDGICPDIIINPHCIPSRMTVNQLMECVLGKACSINGTFGDSTPFSENSKNNAAERICNLLQKAGMKENKIYDKTGWEMMYNGMTGERIKTRVFMGPTYYQRLKHMVSDKMHARSQGNVTTLTRQPLEGRSRDGGLRFGEMERDCIIAHGASRFLKERLFDCSDPYQIVVCDKCGMIITSEHECVSCNNDKVTTCNFPYAAKLLCQELMSIGIKVQIKI